jgi:hypothetical protein
MFEQMVKSFFDHSENVKNHKICQFFNNNAMVFNISINFVFFAKKIVNSPKKGQKNGKKKKISLPFYRKTLYETFSWN